MPSFSKIAKGSNNDFIKCRDAILHYMKQCSASLLHFPICQDAFNRRSVICASHSVRSGFEHSGDRNLYVFAGRVLHQLYPRRMRYFDCCLVLTEAVTLDTAIRPNQDSNGKVGGDSFETLLGALLADCKYKALEGWVFEAFKELIRVGMEALCGPKRKYSEQAATEERPLKRVHFDVQEQGRLSVLICLPFHLLLVKLGLKLCFCNEYILYQS
ncbi:hypothetical protein C8R43DRAFT_1210915 [Mycena crocata]|nr:hypothetical protein C8R43DRAFT_1210915 [Mycena crocata]